MNEADGVVQLGRRLDMLARRWERFFARDPHEPVPPERERVEFERQLRELSRQESRSTSEAFRFEQLLHRFATFNAMWLRQLREREEALVGGHYVRGGDQERPNARPAAPVVTTEGYGALFARFTAAVARTGRQAAVSFDRFSAALDAQRQQFAARGVVVEGFDVAEEDGQVKVRARVRRGRQG